MTKGMSLKIKRIAGFMAIITLSLATTACGTAMRNNERTSKTGCIDLGTTGSGYHVYDCQTTLRDTRRVNCVVVSTTGVDCDWDHVDGADNL